MILYISLSCIFDVLKCFQLAGVAAIAIASKKEESDPPRLDELARFTAGSCQVQDIKDQELQMLKVNTGVVLVQYLIEYDSICGSMWATHEMPTNTIAIMDNIHWIYLQLWIYLMVSEVDRIISTVGFRIKPGFSFFTGSADGSSVLSFHLSFQDHNSTSINGFLKINVQILRWNLNPILPPEWLSLYLQCLFSNPSISSIPSGYPSSALPGHIGADASIDRKYPRETFVNIMQLIDLCILDVESQR